MDIASLARLIPQRLRDRTTAVASPIGLELSAERLHLVQMTRRGTDIALRAAVSLPYAGGREELLADPARFRAFLREALAAAPFAGRRVVSCLPSGQLGIHSLEFTQAQGQSEPEALLKELRERFRETLDESVVDYMPVRSNDVGPGAKSAVVAIAPRARVLAYLELLRAARLEPVALDIGPAALTRLAAAADREQAFPNVLLANFGCTRSFLTVVWGRRLMLDRQVNFGEEQLVGALSRNLDMTRDLARELLRREGLSPVQGRAAEPDAEVHRTVLELLRPDFAALAGEINKTLIYTASQTRGGSVEKIFLLGSVARYPGAAAFVQGLFPVPVAVLDPLRVFDAALDDAALARLDPVAGIAVAAGLALREFPPDV